jgi:SAM-dependent methyltransferase
MGCLPSISFMSDSLYLNPDVLLRYVQGVWLVSNPRLLSHLELNSAAIIALTEGAKGQTRVSWNEALMSAYGRDRTERAMGGNGLHADHSGLAVARGNVLSGENLLDLLMRRRVLIESQEEANALLRPMSSALDGDSLGSFHQRVGQYLFWRRKKESWRAWQDQKFTTSGQQLQPGAYRDIQAPFFDAYFSADRLRSKRVIDFGCGNGYFSARMAQLGADVLALDNSPELLALAESNHGHVAGLRFVIAKNFDEAISLLSECAPGSFDYVYLQDTLLLLIRPESGASSPQLLDLFEAFRRALKPGGRICAMEPNAVFWLAGRYGAPSRPYAIVSEYYRPLFNVVPRLEEVVAFMATAGFALYEYSHPRPAVSGDTYWDEFPIWDFFVFGRAD